MKIGDLVKFVSEDDNRDTHGLVMRVDAQHYGASQAMKMSERAWSELPRGECAWIEYLWDYIGPTHRGIRDRVLVWWADVGWEYASSDELEVVND